MRIWSWTFIATLCAVLLAVVLQTYYGQVEFRFDLGEVNKAYVVNFSVFCLSLLALFVFLHISLRLISYATSIPSRISLWNKQRKLNKQQDLLEKAWLNLLQGRFARAERDMLDVVELSTDHPRRQMIAMMTSARAANTLGELPQRDKLMAEAKIIVDADQQWLPLWVVIQAEFLLNDRKFEEAIEILNKVPENDRLPQALKLTLDAYAQAQSWHDCLRVFRLLAKKKVISESEQAQWLIQIAVPLLNSADDLNKTNEIWKLLKDNERVVKPIASTAYLVYEKHGDYAKAQKVLEDALALDLDPDLLLAYARIADDKYQDRLQKTETWLKKEPRNIYLLRAMGVLCLNAGLWGPAQNYLERSLSIQDQPLTRVFLANLFERTERSALAVEHWRYASEQMLNVELPEPETVLSINFEHGELIEPNRGAGL